MAQDLVTLFNLALSAVGTSRIADPDENSREAQLCRRWYDLTRDTTQRSAHWACCRQVATLSLDAEAGQNGSWVDGDPEPPWVFRYNLPNDYIYPRWLSTYENFEITQHNDVVKILTNAEDPILIYSKRQNNVAAWDADLFYATTMGLAGFIAMPLSGKPDRARNALEEANVAIMRARIQNANQNAVQRDAIPDWLLARGVTQNTLFSQFIYQYGPLFNSQALI
jgi:hypothetical protein